MQLTPLTNVHDRNTISAGGLIFMQQFNLVNFNPLPTIINCVVDV